jgi:hypothetical protein
MVIVENGVLGLAGALEYGCHVQFPVRLIGLISSFSASASLSAAFRDSDPPFMNLLNVD